jgi:hypothetical protein
LASTAVVLAAVAVALSAATLVTVRRSALSARGAQAFVGRAEMARLDAAVAGLRQRLDGLRAAADMHGRSAPREAPAGATVAAAGDNAGDNQPEDQRLARLEGIVQSTGLEKLAGDGQIDPQFLGTLHSDYATRKQASEFRYRALARNEAQHQSDKEKYTGKTLSQLYDVARSQGQESDKALAVMTEQYPNAKATGMVLAERALQSAMSADTPSVEELYVKLAQNAEFADVVTDMGVEAIPAIQHYLIGQYLKEGRVTEAEALLTRLGESYTGSYVADRGESGEPAWVEVDTLVQNLRKEIANAASGASGTLGTSGKRSPGQAGGMGGTRPGMVPASTPASGGGTRPGGPR